MTEGIPPFLRVGGVLQAFGSAVTARDMEAVRELAKSGDSPALGADGSISFTAFETRCRAHRYAACGREHFAIRIISALPAFDTLGLPHQAAQLLQSSGAGLVLISGPTGSGKSTTMAAWLAALNRIAARHIITLEDPIEWLHEPQLSMIDQREVGRDVPTFEDGIHSALRSDPDCIAIGELRTFEAMRAALLAAETGVAVLATVHGGSAVEGLRRVFNAAPAAERDWAQSLLSLVLNGVIAQRFVPLPGSGIRALNVEVLVNTPAVSHAIRSGQYDQVISQMQTGRAAGMLTYRQHLGGLDKVPPVDLPVSSGGVRHTNR